MNKLKHILILFIIILFYPALMYADSTYWMDVTNNTSFDIIISAKNVKCIDRIENEGNVYENIEKYFQIRIRPGKVGRFDFQDDGDGSDCNGGHSKRFDMVATADVDDIDPLDDVGYEAVLRWMHDNHDDNWETIMMNIIDDEYYSHVMTYTNMLCENGDGWVNCSDWVDGGSNFKVTVEETGYQYQVNTINLGDVVVTDGFGKQIPVEPLTHSISFQEKETYYIRFSKTSKYCLIRDKLVSCPSCVEFLSDDDNNLIFACAQTESGQPACPWTTDD
ncbi:MAG: hypothetical protein EP298_00225 [Gammaproteobacteria bacterium]|nr:MAG: hypothetical protein EP298_00225 [Gammaproteobacteria bacterium]UTW41507.1 hypothetical protein KFE69_08280 [bacterium SCSIO 12844]